MKLLSFFLSVLWTLLFIDQNSVFARTQVVATINDRNITLNSFNHKYKRVLRGAINPPSRDQFLEDLVRFEIGVLEAERRRAKYNPDVQLEIRKTMYRWLLELELGMDVEQINVSESEMRRYYRNNPEIRTSHIFLEMRLDVTAQQRASYRRRARQIYRKIKSSRRPFADLAKVYTDDLSTKEAGGDLGWQSRTTMIPHYYDAAVKQRVGGIAPLIETRYGFHIVKLTGRNSYSKANKDDLQMAVFEQKKKRMFDIYFLRLKKRYKVTKNVALMNRLIQGPVNAKTQRRSIASVNGRNITFDSFQKNYKQTLEGTINPPTSRQFLDDFIQFEIGFQEAQRQRVAANSQVKEEIRKLLYRWLIEQELGQRVEGIRISEQEMRQYYRNNPEIRTSHILIEFPQNATSSQRASVKARALQIFAEVRKSKRSFADLAKLYTDDSFTKEMGGDLGWQSRSLMIPAYYRAAIRLRVGQTAPSLVESQYGFHIIKLTGRNTYAQANKEHIRLAVFEQKRKAIFDQFFANLKRRYKIRKYLARLK